MYILDIQGGSSMEMEIIVPIIVLIIIVILYIRIKHWFSSEVRYFPYKRKYLLTKTEYKFYKELKTICDKKDIIICPKVRLEDFISVTSDKERGKYRGYIKSRHVDFLLCDKDLNIISAIELDDYSHETKQAIKTDRFKDRLFKQIGIPLNRIKVASDYSKQINDITIDK